MSETVLLRGDGILGLAPTPGQRAKANLGAETVHLGRRAARPKLSYRNVSLADFVDDNKLKLWAPPPSVDYYTKAAASISRMMKNDQLGCCVISSIGHKVGTWTANDADHSPPGVAIMTDAEVEAAYRIWNPAPMDEGCYIEEVLAYWRDHGLRVGGQLRRIDGYVLIDWTSKALVCAAIDIFGAVKIGLNLPGAWMDSSVWDVTNSRFVGGHDIPGLGYGPAPAGVGYNGEGVFVSSWGRMYMITWAAFCSTRYVEECWAVLAPDWYGTDRKAPSLFDVSGLVAALKSVGSGKLPEDGPGPLPPPPPPVPPTPLPPPNVNWIKVAADATKLLRDAMRRDWKKVQADFIALAADLGFRVSRSGVEVNPNVWDVIADLMALVASVRSRDWNNVLADLMKLAADLGLSLTV